MLPKSGKRHRNRRRLRGIDNEYDPSDVLTVAADVWTSCHTTDHVLDGSLVHRRTLTLGLTGALLGFNVGDRNQANAARRPPPLPPAEKKDPSLSGVQAKVLASKKRKEAMKQEVAKLREKGKSVDGSSPPSE
ncbi:uncharacterized protein LOC120168917 [Hibiscus syriacus]|uniref:uncharacterized protein LOC120168917 n=1 Tax=Hibiscus syriacus TaxID=106335 RepID=UPI001921650A|nr:uncharacterized protein LOC120168917 [Hibiscus syriacus]